MPVGLRSITSPLPVGGLQRDRSQTLVDDNALYDVQNWLINDGRFRVRPGFYARYASIGKYPLGMIQYDHEDEERRVVVGHEDGWVCLDKATDTWSDITDGAAPLSGGADALQVFRTFFSSDITWVLGVNGVDEPKKWDGDMATPTDYENIGTSPGDVPDVARCMAICANRVLLGNLAAIGYDAVQCSENGDMDTGWNTLVGRLSDTPGPIVAMEEMGNLQTAIYKEDSVYVAIAQGTSVPFRFELRKAGVPGPVSSHAVVTLPDGSHAYLANDASVMVFDGSAVYPLGGVDNWRKIQQAILMTYEPSLRARAWGCYDKYQGQLWFVYPNRNDKELAGGIVIDLPSVTVWPISWTTLRMSVGMKIFTTLDTLVGDLEQNIGSYTNTIGAWSVEAPGLTMISTAGQFYTHEGYDDGGSDIVAYFETGLKNLGSAEISKTLIEINHVFAQAQDPETVTIWSGYSDYGEYRTLDSSGTIDPNSVEPHTTTHRTTGRFLCERLEVSTNQMIELAGFAWVVAERGMR